MARTARRAATRKKYKVLAIIPARSGSKGLPRKNLLDLGGMPVIAHTCLAARESALIAKTIVATDGREIADVARRYRVDAVMLPPRLTRDSSPVVGSAMFVIDELARRGEHYDAIALLEPTSPLRKKGDIDRAVKILAKNRARTDAVISLGAVHLESPYVMKKIENGYLKPLFEEKNIQRQKLPVVYFPYGVIYLIKTATLIRKKTFYPARIMPLLIERWQNYEIDDATDLHAVRAVFEAYKPRRPKP